VGPDVHFDNTQYYPFVVRDFAGEGVRSKRYQFFDPKDARVHPVTFARERAEELGCTGQRHPGSCSRARITSPGRGLPGGSIREPGIG